MAMIKLKDLVAITAKRKGYPFTHKHGSGLPQMKGNLILEGPILHSHDYGRKGRWYQK